MEAKQDCDSERIWKIIDKYTPKDKSQRKPESDNIFDKLYNCYINHLSSDKRFRSSTNLLQKLPPETAKVSFIVSLYSDEIGYSISLLTNSDDTSTNGGQQKEMNLPYENYELFEYLDSGEIPPVVLEILGQTPHCHMYNGCIICEVRNYRVPYLVSTESPCDVQRILLKPSQETLLMLLNNSMKDTSYSKEDQLLLESRTLMATQPPLCLDPEIDVTCVQNRLHYNRRKFQTNSLKRYLRRQCQARRAIMHQYSEGPHPEILSLDAFISNQGNISSKSRNILPGLKRSKKVIARPCGNEEIMSEVTKFAKPVRSDISALLEEAVALQTEDKLANSSSTSSGGASSGGSVIGSGTPPTGPSNIKGTKQMKGVDDLIDIKPHQTPPPVQSTAGATPPPRTIIKSATPTPQQQQPRPMIRPRGVIARPMLPGITLLVGNRPILTRPHGLPQLRPSMPRPIVSSSQSSAMPALKLLDLKQRGSSTPPPLSTSLASTSSAKSLPPLKVQSIPVKSTSSVVATNSSQVAMPQLHKLQTPDASNRTTPLLPLPPPPPPPPSSVGGKSKKRKHKH